MQKSIWVGLGGAAGVLLRYGVQHIPVSVPAACRPLLTLFINISGSFLLGFLTILFVKLFPLPAEIRLGVTTGLLGGYTTFSTFCKDFVLLCLSGQYVFAAGYAVLSAVLGLLAAWLGLALAKRMERGYSA